MGINRNLLNSLGMLEKGDEVQTRKWITETVYISPHLGVRYVLEEDERWTLNIMIDESTTKEEVKNCWPKIRKERDILASIQGHDITDYFNSIIYYISERKYVFSFNKLEFGLVEPIYIKPQPKHLVMDVNFDLLVFLIRSSPKNQGDNRYKLAEHYFYSLLSSFSLNQDEIKRLKDVSVSEVAEGKCPFDIINFPISESKLRERLRFIRNQQTFASGKQVLLAAKHRVLSVQRLFLQWGDWEQAEDLLNRSCPITYRIYGERLNARKAEMLRMQ